MSEGLHSHNPPLGVSSRPLTPGLYLVATPIGNLEDMTFRAVRTLAQADIIACEDTRVTSVLLRHYDISTPLTQYHEHNAAAMRPRLLAMIAGGKAVALVSDAGTPLISDPGYKLVRDARKAGVTVTSIPGPCAAIAGLVLSGLPTNRFFFEGFLPAKAQARKARLAELARIPATVVVYEAARRLPETAAQIAGIAPQREIAVARELTKRFEEIRYGTAAEIAAYYAENGAPKGEVALLIGPAAEEAIDADLDALLRKALARMPMKEAAAMVAEAAGLPRRDVYQRALAVKGKDDGA